MGKRSKSRHASKNLLENKVKKLKKHDLTNNYDDPENFPQPVTSNQVKSVKNRNKQKKVENKVNLDKNIVITENDDQNKVSTSKSGYTFPVNITKVKTKKIKVDLNKEELLEENTYETLNVASNESTNNRNLDSDSLREEDVKDEDIDKFCEDITDEDNLQYEHWVQLIESKLGSNKKKPK